VDRLSALGLFVAALGLGCMQPTAELAAPIPEAKAERPPSQPQPATAVLAAAPTSTPVPVDSDGDGFVDEVDECPDMPEDFDGEDDDDGCPDLACRLDPCRIALLEPVYFASDKWEVDERSYRMLDDVTLVLSWKPTLTVEIGGHTDSMGSADYNEQLSERRVDSVKRYLIDHGVSPERLTHRGYGEEVPVDSNRNAEGRAHNRRVEMVRTDTEECPK
jgi:outer membrane protein OmpA-like peptidoglycan-associated protein